MHEGHRKRLTAKVTGGGVIYKHEILEALLFNACPRRNVNEQAHALIKKFKTLKGVFHAPVEELVTVDGIGESMALYLVCLGKALDRCSSALSFAQIRNNEDFYNFMRTRPVGDKETVEFFALDKDGRVRRAYLFASEADGSVKVNSDKIIKFINVTDAYGLFVGCNRPGDKGGPCAEDDGRVELVARLCSMCGVRFYDYCIFGADGVSFSYFVANRTVFSGNDQFIGR